MEVEYKFYIDENLKLEDLLQSEFWSNYTEGAWTKHRFTAYYFDRPDYAFSKHKFALRVRAEDDEYVMTVKTPGTEEGTLSARNEWNFPWFAKQPDLNFLIKNIGSELNQDNLELLKATENSSLFSDIKTDVYRYIKNIKTDGTLIEVSIDKGKLYGGSKEAPCYEIELELKEGSEEVLEQEANKVQKFFNLEKGTESKMARCARLRAASLKEK